MDRESGGGAQCQFEFGDTEKCRNFGMLIALSFVPTKLFAWPHENNASRGRFRYLHARLRDLNRLS